MNDKKRKFSAMVLALGLLAGCAPLPSPGPQAADPEVVTVWNYYNGPQKEAFDALVQQFNETVGREKRIIVEPVSLGTLGGLVQAVSESAQGKVGSVQLPQLAAAYADTALDLDRQGLLADIASYLTEEELAQYVDAYVEEGQFSADGSLKIFPTAKSTEVFTLNLTAWEPFAQATGAAMSDLSTWEVARTAEAYYNWTDAQTPAPWDGKAFFGRDAMANYLLVGSSQLGHDILQVEGGAVTLDFDRDAMRKLWDAYYLPYVKGHYLAQGKFRSDDLKVGSLIAYVGATSGAPYTPETVIYEDGHRQDITCTVLPAPNFAGTEPVAVQQGGGMVLFRGEASTERAAVEFLKWFTQAENNLKFCIDSGYLPVRKDANSAEQLDSAIALAETPIPDVLRQNLLVGMDEANRYTLYTTKPFVSDGNPRGILADRFSEYAAVDRAAVEHMLSEGMTPDEALAALDPDARFQQWFDETYEQLKGLCTQG